MEERETNGRCVFCKGIIIEKITAEFHPSKGMIHIGPAIKGQYKYSSSFYCKKCGLKYEFAPKPS